MKRLFLLILLMFAVSSVCAHAQNSYAIANQSTLLWADSFDSTGSYVNIGSVNTTIIDPSLQLLVNNQGMTNYATGRYYYNFTPTSTGDHYVSNAYYNTTGGLLATETEILSVSSASSQSGESMIGITLIIGILAFMGLLIYCVQTMISNNRQIFQFIIISLVMLSGILVAKATVDSYQVCGLNYASNLICQQLPYNTALLFYQLTIILFSCYCFYILILLLIYAVNYLKTQGLIRK